MITTKEINAVANRYQLRDTQVEKDYVLSWILFAISGNELLSKCLVFKGGTVLKKVYFEDYRFSEDLDFTLLDEKITNEDLLKECLRMQFQIPLYTGFSSNLMKQYVKFFGLRQKNRL